MKIWNESIKTLKKIITQPLSTVSYFSSAFTKQTQTFAKKSLAYSVQQVLLAKQQAWCVALALQEVKAKGNLVVKKANILKEKSSSLFLLLERQGKKQTSVFNVYILASKARYRLQKQSSAYSSTIRVMCKLFIVYIFGSFCWLICNTSKYSKIAFSDQRQHALQSKSFVHLFKENIVAAFAVAFALQGKQEAFALQSKQGAKNALLLHPRFAKQISNNKQAKEIVNLPLLKSTIEPYTAETVENIIFKEKEHLLSICLQATESNKQSKAFTTLLVNETTQNGNNVDVAREVPVWQEFSTQNYVGKASALTNFTNSSRKEAKALKANSPSYVASFTEQKAREIVFFARKPLLLKNCLQQETIFLSKNRTLLKDRYTYSGTSLVIGPENDLLPRKLESLPNKNLISSRNHEISPVKTRVFSPRSFAPLVEQEAKEVKQNQQMSSFSPTRELVWAENLPMTLPTYPDYLPKSLDLFALDLQKQTSAANKNDTWCLQSKAKNPLLEKTIFADSLINYNNYNQTLAYAPTVQKQNSNKPCTDFFYEPRLQSGFNYPDTPLLQNSETGALAYSSKAVQIQKKLPIKAFKYTIPTASTSFQEAKPLKNCSKADGEVFNQSVNGTEILFNTKPVDLKVKPSTANELSHPFRLVLDPFKKSKEVKECLANQEQYQTNKYQKQERPFLEFVYKPNHLQEYISYKKPKGYVTFHKNSMISKLSIRTPTQFVELDKTSDIAPGSCLLEKLEINPPPAPALLMVNAPSPPFAYSAFGDAVDIYKANVLEGKQGNNDKEKQTKKNKIVAKQTPNLVKDFFSQRKQDLRKVIDAPDSFFGGGWLQLGERFTIDKLQGNQQIGVLYNIHSGDPYAPIRELASPYSSTGTSLRTVFGKIKGQKPGVNFTKTLKTNKLITSYRTVTDWAVAPLSTGSWLDKVLTKGFTMEPTQGSNSISNTRVASQKYEYSKKSALAKSIEQEALAFRRLFYFNRVEGKTDSNLESPFQYYNPNPQAEGMSEETLFRIEEYEKSMVFPQIHAFHRGIAFNSLSVSPFDCFAKQSKQEASIAKGEQYKEFTNQDIEIQSILGGMRQRTESESTAEMQPNGEQSKTNNNGVSEKAFSDIDESSESETVSHSTLASDATSIYSQAEAEQVDQDTDIDIKDLPVENEEQNNFRSGSAKSEIIIDSVKEAQEKQKSSSKKDFRRDLLVPKASKQKKSNSLSSKIEAVQKGKKKKFRSTDYYPLRTLFTVSPQESIPQFAIGPTDIGEYNYIGIADTYSFASFASQEAKEASGRLESDLAGQIKGHIYTKGFYLERFNGLPRYSWTSVSKLVFFAYVWYGYKILATALNKSTKLLPVGFTEAIGLDTMAEKYRIIRLAGAEGKQTKTKRSFKDLAGAEKTLSELRDLIWTFRLGTGDYSRKELHIPYFGSCTAKSGQGTSLVRSKTRNRFLLVGPPGTGKTLLVKALAAEANVPVIVQPASQLRMISGVENPVAALFHLARQIKPCIIFLDELDTLGSAIDTVASGSTSEQAKAIRLARKYTYTLLLELDGLTSSTNDLLIIGATNRPETLNPALTRAGRFDTVINCNLPSQEQRLSVLSLYLNQHKTLPLETTFATTKAAVASCLANSKHNKATSSTSFSTKEALGFGSLFAKKNKGKKEAQQVNNNSFLGLYLAQKCYGLSQASIATVVNESALEAMLYRDRPVHTLETLERAIESVKILTGKLANYSPFRRSLVVKTFGLQSKQKQTPLQLLQKLIFAKRRSYNVNAFYGVANQGIADHQKQKKQELGPLCNEYPKSLATTQQFLVFTAYEKTGSLLCLQKQPSFAYKGKKEHLSLKQKLSNVSRNSLEIALFEVYAGKAAASLYSSSRPQIFKLSATSGLYRNPVDVGTNIFDITTLTSLLLRSKPLTFFLQSNKQGETDSTTCLKKEVTKTQKPLSCFCLQAKQNNQQSRFVSETSITKEQVWNFSFASFVKQEAQQITPSAGKQQKRNNGDKISIASSFLFSQNTCGTTKLSSPLTTRWFRVYLYRPFFRYDSPESIENKEYYPINNYSIVLSKNRQPYFRNVSTRRLVKPALQDKKNLSRINSSCELSLPFDTFTYFAFALQEAKQPKQEAKVQTSTTVQNSSETQQYQGLAGKAYSQKDYVNISEESVYLAVVATAFHRASTLVQEHRELLDYSVYKTLRYGVLYEFSFNELCSKF